MDSKSRKKTLREVLAVLRVHLQAMPHVVILIITALPPPPPSPSPSQVELLRNCAPHQHIIRYLDSFIDSNELYIVFESVHSDGMMMVVLV